MNLTVCTDDDQKIKANKTDLAVESEYFRAMLTHAVRVEARPTGEAKRGTRWEAELVLVCSLPFIIVILR